MGGFMEKSKVCKKCGVSKVLGDFYKNNSTNDGHEARCKICKAQDLKIISDRNKAKHKALAEKEGGI
jgi:Zn finger protein HypA/HybF involved in hydrogenase expression